MPRKKSVPNSEQEPPPMTVVNKHRCGYCMTDDHHLCASGNKWNNVTFLCPCSCREENINE